MGTRRPAVGPRNDGEAAVKPQPPGEKTRCSTMPWVRRGKKDYYYRTRRRDGRVLREYHGSGAEARLAAALDDQRRVETEARRQEQAQWEATDAPVQALDELAVLLMRSALVVAGYHQHAGGEWRRRKLCHSRPKTRSLV